ncbi:hypothetical protein KIN20_029184 [Parelaphostrongylus tenuis]|uniref:Uncharacterized protein n=1 Tax=Parelaphostrongylus tenuis TaxID=148309 RepID=A0AAD5R1X8_PARTN|nr:hypothetical protein KIN20_029184 [Parelaphostrongylus tenuis]
MLKESSKLRRRIIMVTTNSLAMVLPLVMMTQCQGFSLMTKIVKQLRPFLKLRTKVEQILYVLQWPASLRRFVIHLVDIL